MLLELWNCYEICIGKQKALRRWGELSATSFLDESSKAIAFRSTQWKLFKAQYDQCVSDYVTAFDDAVAQMDAGKLYKSAPLGSWAVKVLDDDDAPAIVLLQEQIVWKRDDWATGLNDLMATAL